MDLSKMRIYCKVVECGSVTRAAEELHLAQPYVSRVLGELEAAFGGALFDRVGGKRTTPNRRGIALFTHAGRILEEVDRTPIFLNEADTLSGHIMLTTDLAVPRLPEALAQFEVDYPEAKVHFSDPQLETNPFTKDSDVIITTCTERHAGEPLRYSHLYREQFVAVLPAAHPQVTELLELQRCLFILPRAAHGDYTFALGMLAQAGLHVPVIAQPKDTEHMLSMIASDHTCSNCALWPETRLRGLKLEGVQTVQLQDVNAFRWINLAWRPDAAAGTAAGALAQYLLQFYHNLNGNV